CGGLPDVIRSQRSPYGTSLLGAGAVHHIRLGHSAMPASMSGLRESGHDCATYESKDGAPTGRRTVNTEPLPRSLATITSPPIMRASLRVMARPSSVPPKRCAVVLSAWLNSSKSLACCSAVMPMPVSETDTSIQSRPFLTLLARSLTSPSFVNLQALLNRLNRICRRRIGSTLTAPTFPPTSPPYHIF